MNDQGLRTGGQWLASEQEMHINSNFCRREEEHQDISEDRQCIDQSIHKTPLGGLAHGK